MINITSHKEGCILPVRAQPGARRSGVVGEHGGALKIAVNAPPEGGRANKALIELLSDILPVKRSQIELLSGQTSREKRFVVRGISEIELRTTLDAILNR